MLTTLKPGQLVAARDNRDAGKTTGMQSRCRLEGCSGMRVTVRWPSGRITRPCCKGMEQHADGSWKIV